MVLELQEASPEQIESLWTANFASWGAPLDLQGYITRERLLAQTSLLSNGGITFWILVESPGTTPLCACETFNRKRSFIKSPGKQVKEVPVIGVASVFTPSQNRGKGYAGVMMQLLSKRVREMTGGLGFSVLYSDIGPEFYHKNGGWEPHDAFELVLPGGKLFHHFDASLFLSLEQAKHCIERDSQLLRKEFSSLANPDITTVQMLPQGGELEWAHLRGKHAGQHLGIEVGDICGGEVPGVKDEEWGYIVWFPEFKESRLTVLRLREPPSDLALRGLLRLALTEARRYHLSKVTIWSPSERLATMSGQEIITRNHSLPALLFLGEEGGNTAASNPPGQNLVWRNIEKLGWC